MILDGQNYFSDLANGDSPTLVQDTASAYVIDQQVKNGLYSGPGGARIAPWIIIRAQAAGVSAGGGTIQAVVQDSPDNVTWTDRILGAAIAAANVTVGSDLLNIRLLPSHARYIRVIYRIATAAFTAGTYLSFLTPDEDLHDLSQRKATGTVSKPSGALDDSTANGVLAG